MGGGGGGRGALVVHEEWTRNLELGSRCWFCFCFYLIRFVYRLRGLATTDDRRLFLFLWDRLFFFNVSLGCTWDRMELEIESGILKNN